MSVFLLQNAQRVMNYAMEGGGHDDEEEDDEYDEDEDYITEGKNKKPL